MIDSIATTTATGSTGNIDDQEYAGFIYRMNRRLNNLIEAGEPLFVTNAELWPPYLRSFASLEERQYHTCSACRHFMERYGGLATISEDGVVTPVFWNHRDAPVDYRDMALSLFLEVDGAAVESTATGAAWCEHADKRQDRYWRVPGARGHRPRVFVPATLHGAGWVGSRPSSQSPAGAWRGRCKPERACPPKESPS